MLAAPSSARRARSPPWQIVGNGEISYSPVKSKQGQKIDKWTSGSARN